VNHIRILCGIAVVLSAACAEPPPPRTISLSSSLPDNVLIGAERARAAWCAAPVGWCPELVYDVMGDSELRVHSFSGEVEPDGDSYRGIGAHNDRGAMIDVAPYAATLSADVMAATLMHEFGHYGIKGHVPASALMRRELNFFVAIPDHVDAEASDEWCRQVGC
jgi:hypothetical protein